MSNDDESDDEIRTRTVSKFGARMTGSQDVSIDTSVQQAMGFPLHSWKPGNTTHMHGGLVLLQQYKSLVTVVHVSKVMKFTIHGWCCNYKL